MMTNSDALLDVRNLRVEFANRRGSLIALNNVSFSIKKGEVLGVVGESGAGKSMTGNAILGLLEKPGKITCGEIYFKGHRIDNLSQAELSKYRGKQIGSIFQDPLTSLNPLFTIEDQLVETIREHLDLDRNSALEKGIELLRKCGISVPEKRIKQYPHQFSGGMRQRVVIALALATSPSLLIADEPTTALDVSVQAQILKLLKELCRENETAIMLVTHDLGVIAQVADRVAVMYAGQVVELGDTAQILFHPKHPYTKGLMGAIPKIGEKTDFLMQIPGSMPSLNAIPEGCAFHPRCPIKDSRCSTRKPPMEQLEGGYEIRCWKRNSGEDFNQLFSEPQFFVRDPKEMSHGAE